MRSRTFSAGQQISYVRNDPVNLVDPDGRFSTSVYLFYQSAGWWNTDYDSWWNTAMGNYVDWGSPQAAIQVISSLPGMNFNGIMISSEMGEGFYANGNLSYSNPGNGRSSGGGNPRGPESKCKDYQSRFLANLSIYQNMAKQLGIDANFIMALSVHESSWNGSHAQELHNLFGLTNAGGNNLSFHTYQQSADYWIEHYGSAVQGSKTIQDFTDALLKIGYNSVDDDWQTKIVGGVLTVGENAGKTTIGTYKSVQNALKQCDK